MDWSIKATDLAIIFATIVGPILAVQAQGFVDARRDRHRRRLELFHTLMRTRAAPLAADHVNALNLIPLEFDSTDADVRTAFKVYFNHLEKDAVKTEGWAGKRVELMLALLQKIGMALNYRFDTVELEKDVYMPIAHGQFQSEQDLIRQGLVSLVKGELSLPLSVVSMPVDPEAFARMQRVLEKIEKALDAHAAGGPPAQ